jgi:hypothetical protein
MIINNISKAPHLDGGDTRGTEATRQPGKPTTHDSIRAGVRSDHLSDRQEKDNIILHFLGAYTNGFKRSWPHAFTRKRTSTKPSSSQNFSLKKNKHNSIIPTF